MKKIIEDTYRRNKTHSISVTMPCTFFYRGIKHIRGFKYKNTPRFLGLT